ncbi:MAG: hypothetical protein WC516_05515 [Patescibacteria group bacterium]|jgi:hypothetical protein
MTNFSSLKIQAELALAKLTEGKHYVLGELKDRLQKVAETYPQDTVINAMANVVEQLYHKHPDQFISQGDIEKLYGELVGLNATGTKFREVLGDLLLSEKRASVETNSKYIQGVRDVNLETLEYDINKEAKSELDKMFEPISDRYDPQCASAAKEKVELELLSLGYHTARVRLAGGNSKFLVFAADLDTNRGAVRVYVPADASGTQLPSVFVAGDKFEELNTSILNAHLDNAAQRTNYLPNVSAILYSLNVLTGNVKSALPEDDFAKIATKMPAANGSEGLSTPGVFASLPDESKNIGEVRIPKTEVPVPLKILAAELEESVLETAVGYPQAAVRLTKRMLVAELNSMGFKGTQVRVAAPMNDGFICEATINTSGGKTTIEIPVEMKGNAPLLPSVFAKGDYVAEFTAANLHAFAMSGFVNDDALVSRQYSDLDSMGLPQLKDLIVNSALNGDFESCDEALAIIGEKFDGNTYRNVIADYQTMLLSLEETKKNIKTAYNDSDQFVMTPNSIYPVHKKFGRPVHELVRDENGTYYLKSTYAARQNQKEYNVLFNTAKVLVGD